MPIFIGASNQGRFTWFGPFSQPDDAYYFRRRHMPNFKSKDYPNQFGKTFRIVEIIDADSITLAQPIAPTDLLAVRRFCEN